MLLIHVYTCTCISFTCKTSESMYMHTCQNLKFVLFLPLFCHSSYYSVQEKLHRDFRDTSTCTVCVHAYMYKVHVVIYLDSKCNSTRGVFQCCILYNCYMYITCLHVCRLLHMDSVMTSLKLACFQSPFWMPPNTPPFLTSLTLTPPTLTLHHSLRMWISVSLL